MRAGLTPWKGFYFYRYGTTLFDRPRHEAIYAKVSKVAEAIGVEMLEYPEKAFFSKGTMIDLNRTGHRLTRKGWRPRSPARPP